jgi:hypothetical protein
MPRRGDNVEGGSGGGGAMDAPSGAAGFGVGAARGGPAARAARGSKRGKGSGGGAAQRGTGLCQVEVFITRRGAPGAPAPGRRGRADEGPVGRAPARAAAASPARGGARRAAGGRNPGALPLRGCQLGAVKGSVDSILPAGRRVWGAAGGGRAAPGPGPGGRGRGRAAAAAPAHDSGAATFFSCARRRGRRAHAARAALGRASRAPQRAAP